MKKQSLILRDLIVLLCLTGSREDFANYCSSWVHETSQKHSWTSHGSSPQVYTAQLDA